jgi:hypothetical protein
MTRHECGAQGRTEQGAKVPRKFVRRRQGQTQATVIPRTKTRFCGFSNFSNPKPENLITPLVRFLSGLKKAAPYVCVRYAPTVL